jgi:hypothetical protein
MAARLAIFRNILRDIVRNIVLRVPLGADVFSATLILPIPKAVCRINMPK